MASEITQADREAAAALIEAYWSGADASMMKLAASYRAGHSQGVFVRAMAAHRAAAVAELVEAGKFLLDRLVDHEVRMTSDDDAREWNGHVTPAMARFRSLISRHQAGLGKGDERG